MFNQEEKIRCRIGDPKTSHSKKSLRQLIPCAFIIPLSEADDQLDLLLHGYLIGLEKHMENPHIQGKLPVDDDEVTPTYTILIWQGSDNDIEQEEHYKAKPLKLEDVALGRFTTYPMGDYEGSIGITMELSAPWRSESLAGKVDKLSGELVRMQITEMQTSFKSDLKPEEVEEPQPA